MQPSAAVARVVSTCPALRGSGWPGISSASSATCRTRSVPAARSAGALPSSSINSIATPHRAAARCSRARSVIATSVAASGVAARRISSSGPTPAGSPAVRARRGRDIGMLQVLRGSAAGVGVAQLGHDDVHVGIGAEIAQIIVVGLLGLAIADGLAGFVALELHGLVALARTQAFQDVPTRFAPERFGYFAVLQAAQLRRDGGAPGLLRKPVHVAAGIGGGVVVGVFLRQLGEVLMLVDDAVVQVAGFLLRLGRGHQFAGLDQDLPRVELGDDLLAGLALPDQLDNVEAGGAPQRSADVARLHGTQGFGECRWNFVELAPAQVAAIESIGSVGVADGGGIEIHPALDRVECLLRFLRAGADGRRIGATGNADLDVGQMDFTGLVGGAAQQVVDLAVGDRDRTVHHALLQALHHQLITQLAAKCFVTAAAAFHFHAQLFWTELVLRRHGGDGLVDVGIGYANALFLCL